MSISDEILARVEEGRLVRLDPLVPNVPHRRVVYAAIEVARRFAPPWGDATAMTRLMGLRAELDYFSSGQLILVDDRARSRAQFKRLEPGADEVWEIRSRAPKPGIRAFGRFALVDVFVVTNLAGREALGGRGSRAWRDAMVGCRSEWRRLFPAYGPVSSGGLNGYISENAVDARRVR